MSRNEEAKLMAMQYQYAKEPERKIDAFWLLTQGGAPQVQSSNMKWSSFSIKTQMEPKS